MNESIWSFVEAHMREQIAVHCPQKWQAEILHQAAAEYGFTSLRTDYEGWWERYKENVCYYLGDTHLMYGSLQFETDHDIPVVEVVEFDDIYQENIHIEPQCEKDFEAMLVG